MRELKFIISGQKLKKDSNCNFSGITRGTKGYLQAEFLFDKEWKGCEKIAVFRKYSDGKPVRLKEDKCEIPEEVLTGEVFKVYVIGIRPGFRIQTNEVEVTQL